MTEAKKLTVLSTGKGKDIDGTVKLTKFSKICRYQNTCFDSFATSIYPTVLYVIYTYIYLHMYNMKHIQGESFQSSHDRTGPGKKFTSH